MRSSVAGGSTHIVHIHIKYCTNNPTHTHTQDKTNKPEVSAVFILPLECKQNKNKKLFLSGEDNVLII